MRKFIAAVFGLLMISSAAATTIQSEQIEIDLATSQVHVEVDVEELTSSKFTYLTSYPVNGLQARSGAEPVDCEVNQLQIGSEIKCDTNKTRNFLIFMNFTGSDFVTERQRGNIFRYSQSIFRPTKNYTLRVLLPEGTGILDQANVSTPVVSPGDAEISSNGRRIFVEWEEQPQLGETLDFSLVYEEFTGPQAPDRRRIILVVAAAVLLAIGSYIAFIRLSRENIRDVFDELSEDQLKVVKLLVEEDGEMLQKDLVGELDYSKAKVSGLVSELTDEGILVKQKKGRSNLLTISKNYRH